ncbi:hypothetical protein [Pseudonocardia sp. N23]|uniref:hypothetical protein n=1 Tax=Pseudonocardia sp. N23 TaxID=1987376 RepID=UPI001558D190|nr:hypothetical protein [Pseudonocardia sp. N23]
MPAHGEPVGKDTDPGAERREVERAAIDVGELHAHEERAARGAAELLALHDRAALADE